MKIALAQIASEKGSIKKNLEKHLDYINQAQSADADLIVFPELSLTAYWPSIASEFNQSEIRSALQKIQGVLKGNRLKVGLGLPYKSDAGLHITMMIMEDGKEPLPYSKRILHENEKPYFAEGKKQIYIDLEGSRIAPAICYESMQEEHANEVLEAGSKIYISSVVKSAEGVSLAHEYFAELAEQKGMTILFVNGVGNCEVFDCAGATAMWNDKGQLLQMLNDKSEGILIYDPGNKY